MNRSCIAKLPEALCCSQICFIPTLSQKTTTIVDAGLISGCESCNLAVTVLLFQTEGCLSS